MVRIPSSSPTIHSFIHSFNSFTGSSQGRGPRAAGWFEDHIRDRGGDMKSLVLVQGINGWAGRHHRQLDGDDNDNDGGGDDDDDDFVRFMDEYDPAYWKEKRKQK